MTLEVPCDAVLADAFGPCALPIAPIGGGTARRSVVGCDWRNLDTRQHDRPIHLRCYGTSVRGGWVITRIVPVGYLPVSRCYDGCLNASRGSGPLAARSRKSQVRGYLRVHRWMTPAYRPARRQIWPVLTGSGHICCFRTRIQVIRRSLLLLVRHRGAHPIQCLDQRSVCIPPGLNRATALCSYSKALQ